MIKQKLTWLLVVPWSLVLTSGTFRSSNHPDPENYQVQYKGDPWAFECPGKAKEACRDFVDSMNKAFEQRIKSTQKYVPQ